MNTSVAILVPSCDRYADLWPVLRASYRRFWPDCPYEVIVLTNERTGEDRDVTWLRVGPDRGWCANLKCALDRLPHEYVLLHIDDLALTGRARARDIEAAVDWATTRYAHYLRLNPSPPPDRILDDLVGEIAPGALYRTSTIFALWRTSTLRGLLRDEETAWDFEILGSTRAAAVPRFFATREPLLPFENLVIKGRWEPHAVARARAAGLPITLGDRPIMTAREALLFRAKSVRGWALRRLPRRLQLRVRAAIHCL